MAIVEVELPSGTYPAATMGSNVARCFVCNTIGSRAKMFCIGPAVNSNRGEDDDALYIYRCHDCFAGSPSWLKHRMHKSPIGKYYRNLAEEKQLTKLMRSATRGAAREKDEDDSGKTAASSSTRAKTRGRRDDVPAQDCEMKGGRASVKPRKSWRTVSIRRGR